MKTNYMKKYFVLLLSILILLFSCACAENLGEIYDKAFGNLNSAKFLDSEFSVCFIDVGQGDSAIIQCAGKVMLIDAGEEGSDKAISSLLKRLRINYIDIAVGTHDHSDHVGSLDNIIEKYKVGKVLLSPQQTSSGDFNYAGVKAAAKQEKTEVEQVMVGEEFYLGEAKILILAPCQSKYENINDSSIVIKAQYKEMSFLFMSDAERTSEIDIIDSGVSLEADVIKVGHHGSNTSSSYRFLRDVMPKYAVISLAKGNSYGHPHEEVTSRLNDCAATVYRTDVHGNIFFYSDGSQLEIDTASGAAPILSTRKTPTDEVHIANINSKKFHTPECKNLPKEENRIYFASREEAIAKGYSACGGCNP